MLSTTHALRLASRRSLLVHAPTAISFATLRHLSTSRAALNPHDYTQTSTPASPAQPTRSFQPHFQDASQAVSRSVQEWKSSRPHENWTLAHPVYDPKGNDLNVDIVHLEPKTVSDKVAYGLVRLSRWGFDFVSGYRHASPEGARASAVKDGKGDLTTAQLIQQGYLLSERNWMARILLLESIAGVPGFCAATVRHLQSLRLMKRDGGWINSLLQEAENERMHLLTFMKIRDPSKFFRLLVLGAQGVFFNMFFLTYLFSPRAAHRFVGYLEEEACKTYTHIIGAIERGEIPEWDSKNPEGKKVPQVAKDYWRLGDDATMLDLVKAVRADEAGHRFVNHTLANLKKDDFNPVALKHAPPLTQGAQPGWTREESLEWARKVQEEMTGRKPEAGEKKEL